MVPSRIHSVAYGASWWGKWLCVIAVLGVAVIGLLAPPLPRTLWPVWAVDAQSSLGDHAGWILTALSALALVFGGLCQAIQEPRFWRAIHLIVDMFQKQVFQELAEERIDDHRVTLYKFSRWHFRSCFRGMRGHPSCWPWSGWLKPIVRSGPRGRGRTVFLAKDAGQNEGIVGVAFYTQGTIAKTLPSVDGTSLPGAVEEYAHAGFVSPKWIQARIKKKEPLARYFVATRIEINHKPWGVLMIDTRKQKLPRPAVAIHKFEMLHTVLQVLLERA